MENCKHCNHDENKIIYRSKFWTLVFHKQDYLGRCILDANRHVDNFNKLSDDEVVDLRNVLLALENELKDLYNCTMLNWCCNMNNVWSEDNPSPHVHIHVRPRYKDAIKVNGEIYQDKEFGAHYDRNASIQFSEATIQHIYNEMKNNFSKYYNFK
ncbi:MAG: HIT family protein [Clostridia bacterium]|nr:HIT family protein [Clostridia bacterium]